MNYPQVRFIHDTRREAQYICFLAKNISEGFFQKAGLPVLPHPHPRAVYFPDLHYSSAFWNEIKKSGSRNFDETYPASCVEEIMPKISLDSFTIETGWRRMELKFFKLFSEFLDVRNNLSRPCSITVLETSYGTHGSFFSTKNPRGITIYATHRQDLPPGILVKTLLLAFYKIQVNSLAETGSWRWGDRQSVIDYLLTQTSFSRFLPAYSSYEHSAFLISESQNYLASLGFSPQNMHLDLSGRNFTAKEKIFLSLLTAAPGRVVSFDQIAAALWGENSDKFSLAAIARILADVRYKLREQGINREIITTVRGRGYVFNSLT